MLFLYLSPWVPLPLWCASWPLSPSLSWVPYSPMLCTCPITALLTLYSILCWRILYLSLNPNCKPRYLVFESLLHPQCLVLSLASNNWIINICWMNKRFGVFRPKFCFQNLSMLLSIKTWNKNVGNKRQLECKREHKFQGKKDEWDSCLDNRSHQTHFGYNSVVNSGESAQLD